MLVLLIAAVVYVGLNWDTISPKIDDVINDASELKEKGDDLQDGVDSKLDDASKKVDEAREKIEGANEAFEKLIDKVK